MVGDIIVVAGTVYIEADGGAKLKADGSLVSRKRWPRLYATIGMQFADEDKRCCTAELFPLPDLRIPTGTPR